MGHGLRENVRSSSGSSNSTITARETNNAAESRKVPIEDPKPQPPKTPIRILIVGPSRSGKTYTINDSCCGNKEPMASGPYEATKHTTVTHVRFEGKPIDLIDTPGFDNIGMSDVEAFAEIAQYLLDPKHIKTGITGIIYVHRAGNTVHSRSLLRNFRVLANIFLGNTGIRRLNFLVTQSGTQGVDHKKSLDEIRARGSAFSAAFSAGATVASSPNRSGFLSLVRSHLSQSPILLPIQLDDSHKSHTAFVTRVEKELGYYEYEAAQSLLDGQEQHLKQHYEQQLVSQREVEAQLHQQLQQSQLEYSSLRSQLQLHENVEQSEIVQTLQDLNRMIEDVGRSISAYLCDEYVAKTFKKDLADVTALDVSDLQKLKSLVGHKSGRTSFVNTGDSQGMQIECFLDYVIRNKICLYLAENIFSPFHPGVSTSLNQVLHATFESIQNQASQATAGKWRSETFKHVSDPTQHRLTVDQHVDSHFEKFNNEQLMPLTKCVFERDIPMQAEHRRLLRTLVRKAWDWNLRLKEDIIVLGEFTLIAPPHYARFDSESMEEFEANSRTRPPIKILGTLSLGLKSQQAVGAGNPLKETIVCKATVLTKNVYT